MIGPPSSGVRPWENERTDQSSILPNLSSSHIPIDVSLLFPPSIIQRLPPLPRWHTTASIFSSSWPRCSESDLRTEAYERPWKPYCRRASRGLSARGLPRDGNDWGHLPKRDGRLLLGFRDCVGVDLFGKRLVEERIEEEDRSVVRERLKDGTDGEDGVVVLWERQQTSRPSVKGVFQQVRG